MYGKGIFSHILFIPMTDSFTVQKCFSLIEFHFSIFVLFSLLMKVKFPKSEMSIMKCFCLFSSMLFMAVGVKIKSLIHFKLTCMHSIEIMV